MPITFFAFLLVILSCSSQQAQDVNSMLPPGTPQDASPPMVDAAGADGASPDARPGPPPMCSGCRSDQVCLGGQCTDVPSQCPCPLETYCDLAKGRCVIGCTGDEMCETGRICFVDQRRCDFGCRQDTGCPIKQICEGLQCISGCRDDTGCDAGQICEQQQCVAGCRQDSDCASQQICDQQKCVAGCRDDAHCPSGHICEQLLCVSGCRQDSACPTGQICTNQQCVTGCRMDTQCAAGSICDSLVCRTGCRKIADCAMGDICDPVSLVCRGCNMDAECADPAEICDMTTKKCVRGCAGDTDCPLGSVCNTAMKRCVAGCALDGSPPLGHEARCPVGNACMPASCAGNACRGFTCTRQCTTTAYVCAKTTAAPYECVPFDETAQTCMLPCYDDDSLCAPGEACLRVPDYVGPFQYLSYCFPKCQTDANCSHAVNGYNMHVCVCDTPSGACLNPPNLDPNDPCMLHGFGP
jgi:hypothetical protein